VLPPIDLLFRRRRRSVTNLGTGFPLCYLTTVGRRSGRERTVPLLFIDAEHGRIALIGSNWGKAAPPAWVLNLDAHRDATVTIRGHAERMRARRATDEERALVWERALALWPGYDAYGRRAGREIPVFLLDPADDDRSGNLALRRETTTE
jgi:deazaflavin-dependent oxidoreductase (nitroreductase family)